VWVWDRHNTHAIVSRQQGFGVELSAGLVCFEQYLQMLPSYVAQPIRKRTGILKVVPAAASAPQVFSSGN
jgi:hypothetical protein